MKSQDESSDNYRELHLHARVLGKCSTFHTNFAHDIVFVVFIALAYSKVRYRGSTFRPSVHNICQGAYSVAVIAGSMKPCMVITLDTHFKKAP